MLCNSICSITVQNISVEVIFVVVICFVQQFTYLNCIINKLLLLVFLQFNFFSCYQKAVYCFGFGFGILFHCCSIGSTILVLYNYFTFSYEICRYASQIFVLAASRELFRGFGNRIIPQAKTYFQTRFVW